MPKTLHYDFVRKPGLEAAVGPTLSLTRATAATVMDADGYLKRVAVGQPRFTGASNSENLVLQSEDFTTSWATTNATVRANVAIAPNGSKTADAIVDDATAGEHNVNQSVANCPYGLYAYSCYLKAGTRTWARLRCGGQNAFFDLTNGAVGTTDSGITATIQDVGNGWYRCTHIRYLTSTGTLTPVINPAEADNDTTYSGDSTETLYVWGAQLEIASAASTYKPTTTAAVFDANYAGTIASHVERKGLQIEEARTNICLQSEDLTTTWAAINNGVINSNTALAPDGSLTADQLIDDGLGGSGSAGDSQEITTVGGTVYTLSVFAQADGTDWVYLGDAGTMANPSGAVSSYFDLTNGIVGTTSAGASDAGIEDYGNGWYRCWVTGTNGAADTSMSFRMYACVADNTVSITRDGTNSVKLWGAQLEAGAFPTSYIPTTTTSATRNGDAYSTTDASWINADNDEGTIVIGLNQPFDLNQGRIFMSYASSTERAWDMLTSTTIATQIYLSGIVEMSVGTAAITNGADLTYVTSWDSTAPVMNGYLDGVASTPDSTGDPTSTTTSNTTTIGYYGPASTNFFTGYIREIAYFDNYLSATQLDDISTNGLLSVPSGWKYPRDAMPTDTSRIYDYMNQVMSSLSGDLTRDYRDTMALHCGLSTSTGYSLNDLAKRLDDAYGA